MVNTAVVLPCAVLGSICAGMFIFIWWWFPRAWKKGNKQEEVFIGMSIDARGEGDGLTQRERMQMAGQRAREYLQAVEARNKARAEGRDINEPLPVYQGTGQAHRDEPPSYAA